MTDDIVSRLRELISIPLEVADTGAPAYLIAEAADEIERLRAAVVEALRLGALGAVLPNKEERFQ